MFERGFLRDRCANRKGKGTHRGVARPERFRDRSRHVLRGDFYRYLPAIDHDLLSFVGQGRRLPNARHAA